MAVIKKIFKVTALPLTLLMTLFLTYYNFGNDGYGNAYYTAAIKSMTLSWHNFFFVSFDPGGFVSVDKPPVALWLQVVFAKVFGFHTWSIMLPEALAAVASVAIVYYLVKMSFGFVAGITAAVALACTPIFIAASRSNNPDAILALVLILSAWALLVAAERGSLMHLILAAALIGIGFNTKMLVAFSIVPGFVATYFIANTPKLFKTMVYLAIATVVLIVVSFEWIAAVDLTPPTQRPYVGSSATNSEFNLALGYNGFNRVFGNTKTSPKACVAAKPSGIQDEDISNPVPVASPNANDPPGPFRMFNSLLVGQISWFIPLALLGAMGALFYIKPLEKPERRRKYIALMLWGGWAIVLLVFFSVYRSLTHRYYLNILAPGIAALAGIGFSCLLQLTLRRGFKTFLLPATLLISAGLQIMILLNYPAWMPFLLPVLCVCIALAVVLTLILFIDIFSHPSFFKPLSFGLSVGCIAMLLVAPSIWSSTTVIGHVSGGDPYAGPELLAKAGSAPIPPDLETILTRLKFNGSDPILPSYYQALSKYLLQHQHEATYIAAVPDAALAENIIIKTGAPVIVIGGFNGANPILTLEEFVNLVQSGQVKYFLNGPDIKYGANADIVNWVVSHSKKIALQVYDKNAKKNTQPYTLYLLR
jgi:4-amino-4-deoxy-L-arabinose transferase-like glycosyltransferase